MSIFPLRSVFSYTKVQNAIGKLIRNRNFFISTKVYEKQLLNVGCGSNIKTDFINLDWHWRPGVDICRDITQGLPLKDETIAGIFSEHCLEHIDYWQCVEVLREFYRVLLPGGVARIVLPDSGMYLNLYNKGEKGEDVDFPYIGYPERIGDGLDGLGGKPVRKQDKNINFTAMIAVNLIFRGFGHRYAYDYQTIKSLLIHVGFRDIKRVKYRLGRIPDLIVDSLERQPQSLYIEASK